MENNNRIDFRIPILLCYGLKKNVFPYSLEIIFMRFFLSITYIVYEEKKNVRSEIRGKYLYNTWNWNKEYFKCP